MRGKLDRKRGISGALTAHASLWSRKHTLIAAFAASAAAMASGTPAQALEQHALAGVFGKSFESSSGGSLSRPSAVAVEESNGDVYVVDKGNNRIVRFGPEHKFIEAWGFGVRDGSKEYEQCHADEGCLPGIAGFGHGQLDEPDAIAVDNAAGSPSHGDVYVVANSTRKKAAVYKFTSEGELVETLHLPSSEAHGPVDGVAVDDAGVVWLEREDEGEDLQILRFSSAVKNKILGEPSELSVPSEDQEGGTTFEGARPVRPGFALSANAVYITYAPGGLDSEELEEEQAVLKKKGTPIEDLGHPCEVHTCLVAKIPVVVNGEAGEETVEEAEPEDPEAALAATAEVDSESASGVAVDTSSGMELSQDAFVDNLKSVSAFSQTGSLVERFGAEELEAGGGGNGLVVDGKTNEVLLANVLTGQVEVYAYTPRQPGPPIIERGSVFPAKVGATDAEARAMSEPDGAATSYRAQYGEVECAVHESSCKEAIPVPTEEKEGFGVQEVQIALAGLSPSTTYHFRVIAESSLAHGDARVVSEERTFVTQPSPVEAKLLDERAWELVTPPNKAGSAIYALRKEGGLIQAAEDGGAIAYVASGPVGENAPAGSRSPEPAQIVATREQSAESGKDPWSSEDIATSNEAPSQGFLPGGPWEYQAFSSDDSLSLVAPLSESPLNVDEVEQAPAGRDLYIRGSEGCPEDAKALPCFTPLVTDVDDSAISKEPLNLVAAKLGYVAATPDLKHVVFSSAIPLTANAVAGHQGLYLWTAGKPADERLQLISVVPGTGAEEMAHEVFVGGRTSSKGEGGERMAETAISQEGSSVRVVWNAVDAHVYESEVSEAGGALSVNSKQVDEVDTTEVGSTSPAPLFQTASADGSTVFFTDPQHLVSDAASKSQTVSELYAFEPKKPVGQRVTNLTPDLNRDEAADVIGGVLGTSESGSTVYLVANGVLSDNQGIDGEHAQPGDCFVEAPRSHGCSLYVVHRSEAGHWESPRFVVRLSMEDAPDWGAPHPTVLGYSLHLQTARVSPNGEYLAFMSDRHLLGYNNDDANSGLPDEEVYLYRYSHGSLVCASCNPSGAQPVGVEDIQNGGEGEGLAVDRPEAWGNLVAYADHWLAGNIPGWTSYGLIPSTYQSRYLSDEGRLFFNSADALVPVAKPTRKETIEVNGVTREAEVGVENVYEYEPIGTGSCATGLANTAEGCVQLISSGESEQESSFLDASQTGNDVFFLTDARLTAWDQDGAFDIYDARVCEASEVCAPSPPEVTPPCTGEECRPAATPPPGFAPAASSTPSGSVNLPSGSANLAPKQTVLAEKTTQKAKPTRAQLLARALKACKKDRKRARRVACERQANKKYGAKKASSKRSKQASAAHIMGAQARR